MTVMQPAQLAALVAVLGGAVVYDTDVFCAVVQRPALARVGDRAPVEVMGHVHLYGDRRMPVPGVVSILTADAERRAGRMDPPVAGSRRDGHRRWVAADVDRVYLRVSAPINRALTAAAMAGDVPANTRGLQGHWDRVITARAVLQGLAITALCVALVT
jgi:hypothetical protein